MAVLKQGPGKARMALLVAGLMFLFFAATVVNGEGLEETHGCPDVKRCAVSCIHHGSYYGLCIGNSCECIPPLPVSGKITNGDSAASVAAPHGCPGDPVECANHCVKQGYTSGICVGDNCKCLNQKKVTTGGYDPISCVIHCLPCIGVSIQGQCTCFRIIPDPNCLTGLCLIGDESHGCPKNPSMCVAFCKKQGHSGGYCTNSDCQCYDDDGHGCPTSPSTCVAFCKNKGHSGGNCVNSDCQCVSAAPTT